DLSHALGQLRDQREVVLHFVGAVFLQQESSVVGKRAERRKRLVEFMRDTCRHLPERCHLACMYQLVLRFAKHPFGSLTLGNLTVQLRVRCNEIGSSLRYVALELVVCLLQRLLGRQTLLDRATSLMQKKEQQENERQRHRSERDSVADERIDGG